MKKPIFLPVLFLVFSQMAIAQTDSSYHTVSQGVFNFVGGLGLSTEKSLSKNNTLFLRASTNTAFDFVSNNAQSSTNFSLGLTLLGQYRHFYNLQKRIAKGRPVAHNWGNYIAFQVEQRNAGLFTNGATVLTGRYSSLTFGPVWGTQIVKNRFVVGFSAGLVGFVPLSGNVPGSIFSWPVQPTSNFSLGILLGKNK